MTKKNENDKRQRRKEISFETKTFLSFIANIAVMFQVIIRR